MKPLKYFVFNKARDYRKGYREHIQVTDQGIRLNAAGENVCGTFISRPMDSGEEKNSWQRAVIESNAFGDDSIRFYFYCSDTDRVLIDGTEWTLEELICSEKFSLLKKEELMKPYLVHQMLNPHDVLLYQAKGRFLWMEIQLFCQSEFEPEICRMKIYAENHGFDKYLPEIYQTGEQNDFLKRYLSLFESVYQDLDTKIREVAGQFDPDSASPEFLRWIARWTGVEDVYLWSGPRLRILLNGIVKRNLIRGTREYMEFVIQTFTGEKPFIVEDFELDAYRGDQRVYGILSRQYAHKTYEVNILVQEKEVPTPRKQKALEKIIDNIRPAQVKAYLIVLRPYIYLSENTYLGINSALGTYQKASLDGVTMIPSVVAARDGEEEGAETVREAEEKNHEESEEFSI